VPADHGAGLGAPFVFGSGLVVNLYPGIWFRRRNSCLETAPVRLKTICSNLTGLLYRPSDLLYSATQSYHCYNTDGKCAGFIKKLEPS